MVRQRGNVLFLILIAVALFAALSYAVTRSSRGGSGNVSEDKLNLAASNILNYGASIKTAIMRIKITGGCADEQISFETPVHWYNYANPNAPLDKRCHVFHPSGGNLNYQKLESLFAELWGSGAIDSSSTEHFFGRSDVPQIGTNCATALCSDLYLGISLRGTAAKEVCEAYNKRLDLPAPHVTGNGPWF